MSAFFFQRINDHIQYLRRLEKRLKGDGDFQGSDYHDCQLGKWLYGPGQEEVIAFGEDAKRCFEKLLEPHRHFHEAGALALVAAQEGRTAEVKAAITEMLKLSNTLVNGMMDLDRLSRS
jgi:hypothetical protein